MINEILQSINQLLALDSTDDAEKERLLKKNSEADIRQLAGHLTTRDILILAKIAQTSPYLQKDLHRQINISQPTASRAVDRLIKLDLLTRTKMAHNQKEWQLALTPLGQRIAILKQNLDQARQAQAATIASHYTAAELAKFNQFIQEIIALKTPQ
jgi:DNA-binding MarR family transcriptional regulator